MRKIRMSGSVGASGEQSPEATRPRMLPLPQFEAQALDEHVDSPCSNGSR